MKTLRFDTESLVLTITSRPEDRLSVPMSTLSVGDIIKDNGKPVLVRAVRGSEVDVCESVKEMNDVFVSLGMVERKNADPEGGFYGNQTWAEVTDFGRHAGLSIFRHARGREVWAGEVVPIARITMGLVDLYSYED